MNKNTVALAGASVSVNPSSRAADQEAALDRAFEILKSYDYGASRGILMPIDEAVRASLGNAAAQGQLADRLAVLLGTHAPVPAKEYICLKLSLIGSSRSVPALAALLVDSDLAYSARNALESMPCPEAVAALRDALSRLSGLPRLGVIQSLGSRRDTQCISALTALLSDADPQVVHAAVAALGDIGTPESARRLREFDPKTPASRSVLDDACLVCAEQLLNKGKNAEAEEIYHAMTDPSKPKLVQLAARLGLDRVAGKD
ncbi:MAG: HEAT repeat domain-containing protein [Candidatus Omnitrophica bacterium]|nr:HEAT repeat domain-containing protein [Candidatus Omnitrophota bacterium]